MGVLPRVGVLPHVTLLHRTEAVIRIKVAMYQIVLAVIYGGTILLLSKLAIFLYHYAVLCRALRKIPHHPVHWLRGNEEVVDSTTYIQAVKKLVNEEGARVYCVWLGPFPAVGVTHPSTVKELIHQESRKARGQADGYRFMLPWIGDGILLSEGPKWERNRKLLTPAFHFEILKGYVIVMNRNARKLMDKLWNEGKGGASFDISPLVYRATLDIVLQCALSYEGSVQDGSDAHYIEAIRWMSKEMWERMTNTGAIVLTVDQSDELLPSTQHAPIIPLNDVHVIGEQSKLLSLGIAGRHLELLPSAYGLEQQFQNFIYNITPDGRRAKKQQKVVHNFIGSIIKKRIDKLRDNPDPTTHKRHLDFLDILLTAKDEKGHGLSLQEVQDEVDNVTFAGHDTTASATSFTILALAQYPDLQQKVYQEVQEVLGDQTEIQWDDLGQFNYLTMFIKEVLRYFSPVPMTARKHTSTIVLGGFEIPPGPRLDINIVAMNHSKEIWGNPEVFDPERFSANQRDDTEVYSYIPFSAGQRNCIGQHFAMNELKISIATFVRRFKVSTDPKQAPILLPETVMKTTNGVFVSLEQRK